MILPFALRCQISHLIEHILNENTVPAGGIIDQNVCNRADELAVLNYTPTGASALCALGATNCVCLTANRRGAICGICPREQAPGYKLP